MSVKSEAYPMSIQHGVFNNTICINDDVPSPEIQPAVPAVAQIRRRFIAGTSTNSDINNDEYQSDVEAKGKSIHNTFNNTIHVDRLLYINVNN